MTAVSKKLRTGLKELPQDTRDFHLGAIIPIKDFPKPEDLPKEFVLETSDLKNQISDFCTGNTTALIIGTNEGVPMDENWMFAKSKEITGNPKAWGQNLRDAFKVGIKFGALPKKNSPFDSSKGSDFLRRIENWGTGLDFFATPHKQETYWRVTGPYDTFDNIKGTIWYLNKLGQKQGVGIGLLWGYPASQYILSEVKEQGDGHAITVKGWKDDYLILQNSWGKDAGKNGEHLISREVVNYFTDKFGAYVYLDMPREKAEFMLENKIVMGDNWLTQLWKSIKSLITNFFWPDREFGANRSSKWDSLRKEFLIKNPVCAVCYKKGGLLNHLNVHHIKPFHLFPNLELNPENLITLCRIHHLEWGHFFSFKSYNLEVREWALKRKNRP